MIEQVRGRLLAAGQEQRDRIGEQQAGDRDDQADRPRDLHDAPKDAVPQELHEDVERPPFLVHASLQHEEDGIGVEDNEIENEGRRQEAARRQSYGRRRPGTICG